MREEVVQADCKTWDIKLWLLSSHLFNIVMIIVIKKLYFRVVVCYDISMNYFCPLY